MAAEPVREAGVRCQRSALKHGVSYRDGWTDIDAWSERVIDYFARRKQTQHEAVAAAARDSVRVRRLTFAG